MNLPMSSLLRIAIEKDKYDVAAHALVFGLIKAKKGDREREEEKRKKGILRQSTE